MGAASNEVAGDPSESEAFLAARCRKKMALMTTDSGLSSRYTFNRKPVMLRCSSQR